MLDDLVHLLGRKQPPVPAFVPGLTSTPPTRALPARTRRRRGRILGGRNFRELRFSRRSSSATRASSRWFASTSSPTRSNNATAFSRSPSRIASASARSTPQGSPPGPRSLHRGERLLKCRHLQALYRSPLTDSNRRPPPYHGIPAATGRNPRQRFSPI